MYQIKTKFFQGPLDLLLDLIEKRKLSINEISLAEIADQYLDYFYQLKNFPLEEISQFIVIAATLMLIKSRSLMPSLEISEEEEEEIRDLERRLKLYKKFNILTKLIQKFYGKNLIFSREPFSQVKIIFVEPKNLDLNQLKGALQNLLERKPKKEILPENILKRTISLEKRIEDLISKLKEKASFCFSEISGKDSSCAKIETIMNFLAVLELIKRGFIIAQQEQNFGEIKINRL